MGSALVVYAGADSLIVKRMMRIERVNYLFEHQKNKYLTVVAAQLLTRGRTATQPANPHKASFGSFRLGSIQVE
jgi:hypothetical protein